MEAIKQIGGVQLSSKIDQNFLNLHDLDMGYSNSSGPSEGTSPRLKKDAHKSGSNEGSGISLDGPTNSKDSGTKKVGRMKRFMSMVGLRKK